MSVPKFAVVGSGPAGLGVLTALLAGGLAGKITLFEIDRPLEHAEFSGAAEPELVEAYYDGIYRELWRGQKRKFPPPKTHFAVPPQKLLSPPSVSLRKIFPFPPISNFGSVAAKCVFGGGNFRFCPRHSSR